jgi:hypothetical protein
MTSLVLELAVYQATQYKIAIFFKHENRSVTLVQSLILFVGSFIQQKNASACESSAWAGGRRNTPLGRQPYFRPI